MQRRSSGPASEADPASRRRSGGHASTPRASGRRASVELALSTRQSQPCELHSASPPRSSGRTPGGDPLEGERGRRLRDFLSRCDSLACALSQVGSLPCPCKCRLRRNTREFDASGRVLRLKRYLASDVGGAVLDAVLDALAVNTRVEVLYIQNFEKGFDDHTLMKLLAVLKLRRIWAVNVGENFGVSLPAWRVFTAGLRHTNVQFMYASDRGNTKLAHRYDTLTSAVLKVLCEIIQKCNAANVEVSVCGEMAGDVGMTKLLLGLGLRSFSMHPSQILAVKQQILRADTAKLKPWADLVLGSEDPAAML